MFRNYKRSTRKQKTEIVYDWDTDEPASKMYSTFNIADCYQASNKKNCTLVQKMLCFMAKCLYFIVFPILTVIRYLEKLRITITNFLIKDTLLDCIRKSVLDNKKRDIVRECYCCQTKWTQTNEARFDECDRLRKVKNVNPKTELNKKIYKTENNSASYRHSVRNVYVQTKSMLSNFTDHGSQFLGRDYFPPVDHEKHQKGNHRNTNFSSVNISAPKFKGKPILCKKCFLLVAGQSVNTSSLLPGRPILCSRCLMVVMGFNINENDFEKVPVAGVNVSSSAEADNETEEEKEAQRCRREYLNKKSKLEKSFSMQIPNADYENMNYTFHNSNDRKQGKEYIGHVKSGCKRKVFYEVGKKKSKLRGLHESEGKYHEYKQPCSSSSDESQTVDGKNWIFRKLSSQQLPQPPHDMDDKANEFTSEKKKRVYEQTPMASTSCQTYDTQLYHSRNLSTAQSESSLQEHYTPSLNPLSTPVLSAQSESIIPHDNKASLNLVSTLQSPMQSEFQNTVNYVSHEEIESKSLENKLSQNHLLTSLPPEQFTSHNMYENNLYSNSTPSAQFAPTVNIPTLKYTSSSTQPIAFEKATSLGCTDVSTPAPNVQHESRSPHNYAPYPNAIPSKQFESNSAGFLYFPDYAHYSYSVAHAKFKSAELHEPPNPISIPAPADQFKSRILPDDSTLSSSTTRAQFKSKSSLNVNPIITPRSTLQLESRSSSGYDSSSNPVQSVTRSMELPDRPASASAAQVASRTSPTIHQALYGEQFSKPRRGVLHNVCVVRKFSEHNETKMDPEEKWKQVMAQRNLQYGAPLEQSGSSQSLHVRVTQSLEDLQDMDNSNESLPNNTGNDSEITSSYRPSAFATLMGVMQNSSISDQSRNPFKAVINRCEPDDFYSMENCKYIYTRPRTVVDTAECTKHNEKKDDDDDDDDDEDEDDYDDKDDDDDSQYQSLDKAPSVQQYNLIGRRLARTASSTSYR